MIVTRCFYLGDPMTLTGAGFLGDQAMRSAPVARIYASAASFVSLTLPSTFVSAAHASVDRYGTHYYWRGICRVSHG